MATQHSVTYARKITTVKKLVISKIRKKTHMRTNNESVLSLASLAIMKFIAKPNIKEKLIFVKAGMRKRKYLVKLSFIAKSDDANQIYE